MKPHGGLTVLINPELLGEGPYHVQEKLIQHDTAAN